MLKTRTIPFRAALLALVIVLALGACGPQSPGTTATTAAVRATTPGRDPADSLTATAVVDVTRTAYADSTATHVAGLTDTPLVRTPVTPSPTWTRGPLNPTITPTPDYSQCAWMWATQPQPELSAEITAALEAAGLTGARGAAESFGENCIPYNAPGAPARFATMETDFGVTLPVGDLENLAALGDAAVTALNVLATYPPDSTPGPNPGRITLIFTANETQKRAVVGYNEGVAAAQNMGGGAALIDAIGGLH